MLRKIFDEWNTQNIDSNNSKIAKIITNDDYFRIRNIKELQQVLNEEVTSTTFVSIQTINDIIKKTYNKSSYLIDEKSHSNEEYEYDNDNMTKDFRKLAKEVERATINIKDNAIEVVDTLEEVIGNDAIREKEIPLPLRFRLRRQNATITEKKILSICNNYWKDC